MLDFFKSKSPDFETKSPPKLSMFQRLKQRFTRSRQLFAHKFANLFNFKGPVDEKTFQALEQALLKFDVGLTTTKLLMDQLKQRSQTNQTQDGNELRRIFKQLLLEHIQPLAKPMPLHQTQPTVILMVGINGAGKTTSIGKLTAYFKSKGKTVMLAAGDTFRAAAVAQLQIFAERCQVPIIAQSGKADSAAVIFDALQSAKAKQIDILIADTAGRLHTQQNLMNELKKIIQVLKKLDPNAPHEIILVLDASIGQNALAQVKHFNQLAPIQGIILSKLDGSAKGGSIFSIAHLTSVPIYFIGFGEDLEDIKVFDPVEYIEALFPDEPCDQ